MSKMQVYSFVGSQWAGVAHLALAEKGFTPGTDYDIQEIDLGNADNFSPAYLAINPNGTVPSLTAPSLASPLTSSIDILRHLDSLSPDAHPLVLRDNSNNNSDRAQQIIDLVHSPQVDTNILFFRARSVPELDAKKRGWHKDFIDTRQQRLETERAAAAGASHPFYKPKLAENGTLYDVYAKPAGHADDDAFFAESSDLYRGFAAGMAELETLLVLPYAAGASLSEADFHVIPWLAHAMVAAESDIHQVQDFSTLEKVLAESVPGFKVGPRTRAWWKTVAEEASFQKVFPQLH
ncbi:hypothetical protein LMH87_010007 [Akanthomyces muscarius]|uniref:GST N-terminal domain-containing protein n=1 Tax=Akanthomyces muscarius TaxID=2231603 RepID=A0A9W8ULJ4_AKAMU|nr:hypothetical protein LMH87_010007 [Akanthomyces muscarius]KAJ4153523.1 hypothetical protein LMH87_010007 [Akanthomyces muscarius]